MLYCYARNGRTIPNSPILQHAIQDPNLPIGHFFLDMVNLDIPRLDLYSQLHVHPHTHTHIISLQTGNQKKLTTLRSPSRTHDSVFPPKVVTCCPSPQGQTGRIWPSTNFSRFLLARSWPSFP